MLMFAHVSNLRYWKSERADITTCEDASRADMQRGLFCVADGAGTTLFSNIWADILVNHFIHDPLAGIDLFEMEWWIRQAQKRYRERAPQLDTLNWNARQKAAEQGAYSTLATLRIVRSAEQTATAELLVIGDSCVIIGQQRQEKILAFPLLHSTDFDRAPYCVPALLKNLNRKTLYARQREVTLAPGDTIILATDAVARWIIAGGTSGQEGQSWQAFQEVASKQTDSEWRAFIDNCRANQSIVDDDSTALIIRLSANGPDGAQLGHDSAPGQQTIEARLAEFKQARADDNKELIAILYGDGHMLQSAGIMLSEEEKTRARVVADALREVLQAMREAVKTPNFAAKMESVWWQYADLLMDEPCAETVRKTLANQGVRSKPPLAQAQQAHQAPQFHQPASLPLLPAQPLAQASISEQASEPVRLFVGNEPEPARIFSPLPVQERAELRAFRAALLIRDDEAIVKAYKAAFESELTKEERLGLENARQRLTLQLVDRLRLAIDTDNDDEILAVERAMSTSPVSITPSEFEKKRIQQAIEHKAAAERLEHVLEEGTPHQKVEAFHELVPKRLTLTANDQFQLDSARRLVEALQSNNDYEICLAYDALEFSPLRKHFTFTREDQQRIQDARNTRAAIQQLRAILQNDKKNVALLVDTYQLIRAPRGFLSPEDQHLVEVALAYVSTAQDDQKTIQLKGNTRVQLYDELFFSPYHFTFSTDETKQIERERELLHLARPPLAQVNQTIIDSTHFLALYFVKPLHANRQIGFYQKLLASENSETRKRQQRDYIAYWHQHIAPFSLPQTVLNDLISQALIEQGINEEAEKTRRSLEKEAQKELEEYFKEIRVQLVREDRAFLIPLNEQQWRTALLPYAQHSVFTRHLQNTAPGQTLERWLGERRHAATILYYQRPDAHALTTRDQQECWLFKWWFLRQARISPQGETEHA